MCVRTVSRRSRTRARQAAGARRAPCGDHRRRHPADPRAGPRRLDPRDRRGGRRRRGHALPRVRRQGQHHPGRASSGSSTPSRSATRCAASTPTSRPRRRCGRCSHLLRERFTGVDRVHDRARHARPAPGRPAPRRRRASGSRSLDRMFRPGRARRPDRDLRASTSGWSPSARRSRSSTTPHPFDTDELADARHARRPARHRHQKEVLDHARSHPRPLPEAVLAAAHRGGRLPGRRSRSRR